MHSYDFMRQLKRPSPAGRALGLRRPAEERDLRVLSGLRLLIVAGAILGLINVLILNLRHPSPAAHSLGLPPPTKERDLTLLIGLPLLIAAGAILGLINALIFIHLVAALLGG